MPRYTSIFLIAIIGILVSLVFYQIPMDFLEKSESDIVQIYFADNMTPAHNRLIANFNALHDGKIEVVPIDLPFNKFTTNERKELVARALRNKNSKIDIFTVDCISVSRFAKWAEPLAPYLSVSEREELIPESVKTWGLENQWISLPLHLDIGVMFYRKDFVRQIDSTGRLEQKIKNSISWNELIALKNKTAKNRPIYLFQGDNYEGLICNCFEIAGSIDPDVTDRFFNNPQDAAIQKTCNFLYDLIYKYKVAPEAVTGFNENSVYEYAVQNDVPFFRGWPGFLREIDDLEGGPAIKAEIGIAPLPSFSNKTATFGGWNLMVSRNSNHKEETVLFLKYLISNEAQRILFEEAGFLPVKSALYHNSELLEKYPYLADLEKIMETGIYRPSIPNYTVISDIFTNAVNKGLRQEIIMESALAGAALKIQPIIQRNDREIQ